MNTGDRAYSIHHGIPQFEAMSVADDLVKFMQETEQHDARCYRQKWNAGHAENRHGGKECECSKVNGIVPMRSCDLSDCRLRGRPYKKDADDEGGGEADTL